MMLNQKKISANEGPMLATFAFQAFVESRVQQDPDTHSPVADAISACQLGAIESKKGNAAEAEVAYRRALKLKPDFAEALNNLGLLLARTQRFAEAEAVYHRALELEPDFLETLNNMGNLFARTKRFVEAEAAYHRALELKPDFLEALNNLGNLFASINRFVEAEAVYRRALKLKPDSAQVLNNLGSLYTDTKRFVEAEAAYGRALELDPEFANVHNNRGVLLTHFQRCAEAEIAYRRALELEPDSAEVQYNLSCLFLGLGRYSEAWNGYELRYDPRLRKPAAGLPHFLPFPQWHGECLVNRSIVMWIEQGLGDQVQFVRYAPLLKKRGVSHITVLCHPALKSLFETVEGVDAVVTNPNTVPLHDYWSLFMSLPLYFATTVQTIPARTPYILPLRERMERWRKKLPRDGLRVGLVWKGNAAHSNDASRSLPAISALSPLWSVPGVTFISLQKGQGEDEAIRPPVGQPLTPLGHEICDIADTAAIVAQLDLTICVDTVVAHVAGALGKPCWVMLPLFNTDWRWLKDRSDSPWYPKGMRLFRQTKLDDWTEVIEEVTTALKDWTLTRPHAYPTAASSA